MSTRCNDGKSSYTQGNFLLSEKVVFTKTKILFFIKEN